MLKSLCLSLMLVGLCACDDEPQTRDDAGDVHDHDTQHDHDVNTDTSDDAEQSGIYCTASQIDICEELGAGAGCCESTDSCYIPPCAPDCCPTTE